MQKVVLGRTNIEVTRVGYGTWGLGGVYYGEVEHDQGVQAVQAYLDAGGNHLDTAYSYHSSEDIIGAAIADRPRESMVITSKTYAGCFDINEVPLVRDQLEVSLTALGTDYVDVYMIHGSPKDRDRMNALIEVFTELREEGKIRAIGCSIPGPGVTDDSVAIARQYIRSGAIDVMQLNYSIVRQKMAQVFGEAREHGVAIVARWVLESGMLGGRYKPGHQFIWPDTRNRFKDHERDAVLETAQKIAADLPEGYSSPAEVAIAFALQNPMISAVVLGGTTADRVRQNCAMDQLPPLLREYVDRLEAGFGPRNDQFNPTGEFEHVPSPRGAEA